jgi:hypothetical protein
MGGTGDEIYHHTQTQNIFNNTFVNYHGSALIASYEDPTVLHGTPSTKFRMIHSSQIKSRDPFFFTVKIIILGKKSYHLLSS